MSLWPQSYKFFAQQSAFRNNYLIIMAKIDRNKTNTRYLQHITCMDVPLMFLRITFGFTLVYQCEATARYYLKIFFRISVVTLRVAVVAADLAALPRMDSDELFFLAEVDFFEEEEEREEVLPVIFLPTDVPT